MGDSDVGNDTVDRALRLFVYGPLGLACYLKDSAPTFTELFVSRGKREVDGVRRTVEEKLGFAKPEPAPAPSPQQRMADSMAGLTKMAAQATSMAATMAGPVVKAGAGAAANVATQAAATAARTMTPPNGGAPTATPTGAPAPTGASPSAPPAPSAAPAPGPGPSASAAAAAPTDDGDLPISGYDGLSASQIIERLDGMSRGALERVRGYELAHRARRTILASIDNLTS